MTPTDTAPADMSAARQRFLARAETFGLDTADPWALPALRMLFAVPRAYEPLVAAWEVRHPGTRETLDRLSSEGLVAGQAPVIVDTRTGNIAQTSSRRVPRYRTSGRGHHLAATIREDPRVLADRYPKASAGNATAIAALLDAYDLEDSHAKFGISASHALALSGLGSASVAKWWTRRWLATGMLRQLDDKIADVREVVPAHWRITRALCRQLTDVLTSFDRWPNLDVELRLSRSRFLNDIDPARIGLTGATDYDHDVQTQRVLSAMLSSPRAAPAGLFLVEPKVVLPLDLATRPFTFTPAGTGQLFYQPDAELREIGAGGQLHRSVVEYERFQSRRDAWNHVERFLGYIHLRTLPREPALLRFVVDSRARERAYVHLIEAFADYTLDYPERVAANRVTLAVSSLPRLQAADDPLDDSSWFRVVLPHSGEPVRAPVIHPADNSPYDDYFGRGASV